jgi:hypothetical protein
MTDQERILKLLESGKITKDQAEELLEALDAAEEAESRASNADEDFLKLERKRYAEIIKSEQGNVAVLPKVTINPKSLSEIISESSLDDAIKTMLLPMFGQMPLPPIPPALMPDSLAYELALEEFERNLPKGPYWVRVVSVSGDVTVRVDPELVTPVAHGNNGPLPITAPARKGKLTITVLNEDLDLVLPLNYGVILDVKSGDIEIEECFAIGQVLSGDVSLDSVSGVILTVMSGDVNGTLLINEGKHALKVMSGDADIRLLSGSSVSVQGVVRSGNINVDTSKNKNSTFGYVGSKRFIATVGKPEKSGASLDLSAMSGDLTLEVDDE